MDLGLTWRADYVVRAALELARRHNTHDDDDHGWCKAGDLASATGIPVGYVRQILRMLVQHGIAEARAGSRGGYRFGQSPGEITVLDVVEVAEGPLASTRCVLAGTGCDLAQPCVLHAVLARAQEALRAELSRTTLARLVGAA